MEIGRGEEVDVHANQTEDRCPNNTPTWRTQNYSTSNKEVRDY